MEETDPLNHDAGVSTFRTLREMNYRPVSRGGQREANKRRERIHHEIREPRVPSWLVVPQRILFVRHVRNIIGRSAYNFKYRLEQAASHREYPSGTIA